MIEIEDAARQIAELHERDGGSTFSLHHGNLAGKHQYSVSIYPERGLVIAGRSVSRELVRRFIRANLSLLEDARNSVGTWLNEDDGNTYLDVSVVLPTRADAVRLETRYNQIAIFDLESLDLIDLGGTGEPIPDLPPLTERLALLETDEGRVSGGAEEEH